MNERPFAATPMDPNSEWCTAMRFDAATQTFAAGRWASEPQAGAPEHAPIDLVSVEMDVLLRKAPIYCRLPRDPVFVTIASVDVRPRNSLVTLADAAEQPCGTMTLKEFNRRYEGFILEGLYGVNVHGTPEAYVARTERVRAIPNPNGPGMLLCRYEPTDRPSVIRWDRYVVSDEEFGAFSFDDEYNVPETQTQAQEEPTPAAVVAAEPSRVCELPLRRAYPDPEIEAAFQPRRPRWPRLRQALARIAGVANPSFVVDSPPVSAPRYS